jgi:subtilisin family serine protease
VVHASRRYQTVTVVAKPVDLPHLAAIARVGGVTEVRAPIVSASGCSGLVTSEGDTQLKAASARSEFGLDGAGVTVGVLSDSFDTDASAPTGAAEDVASGDLPGPGNPCGHTTPTHVLQDFGGSEATDEGRAMAQIVHDLAPGASLGFATAFGGEFGFADNIRALANAGAKVIVDDVSYPEEPFFQEGPVGVAAGEVAANGVAYFSSAANNNLIDVEGNDIASWEAPSFRDTECPPEMKTLLSAEVCMDFDPGAGVDPGFEITVSEGATLTVDLQWDQPWNGVTTDLDAFLLDSEDKPLVVDEAFVDSSEDNVGVSQRPVEVLQWENKTESSQKVRLAINRCFAACNPAADSLALPRLKFALLENGGGVTATEYPKSLETDTVGPTIFGHNGGAGVISVGAVPFDDNSEPEPYSSHGPVTHYFGPVSGASPAPELEQPQELLKPDLVATDCGLTTFFVPTFTPGIFRFCGTSAAAPHAAAVAALMRQANPSLSLTQLRTAMAVTARPVGAFGVEAVGAGLLDALGAVSAVALPPQVAIISPPKPLSGNRQPSIGFAANRPVVFSCVLDGGPPSLCASPFTPAPLADGEHHFSVTGIDVAGRSGTSNMVSFSIDTRPPRTFFRTHPHKLLRTRFRKARAVFRFGSDEGGATFFCRVDGGLFHSCPERFARRFRLGPHVLRVEAGDAAGNVDSTPAVFRFRVVSSSAG